MELNDGSEEQSDDFPNVRLDWAYDDADNPATVTLFDPRSENIVSAWITVDCETGVCLDQVR